MADELTMQGLMELLDKRRKRLRADIAVVQMTLDDATRCLPNYQRQQLIAENAQRIARISELTMVINTILLDTKAISIVPLATKPQADRTAAGTSGAADCTVQKLRLYRHKTDGGAEYLTDKCVVAPDGTKEGVFVNATVIVRVNGRPEITIRKKKEE